MTELLYLDDSYQRTFEATVVEVVNGEAIVLDQTAFYATGGGQPHDLGIAHRWFPAVAGHDGREAQRSSAAQYRGKHGTASCWYLKYAVRSTGSVVTA